MKKIFAILLFSLFVAGSVMAAYHQPGQPGRKLKALKTVFVTRQLNLSAEEAEKFWPVYDSYIAELRKTRFEQKTDDILEQEESTLAIRKKYRAEFKKILNTDARANRALMLERDFNNLIRKELQTRREARKKKDDKN